MGDASNIAPGKGAVAGIAHVASTTVPFEPWDRQLGSPFAELTRLPWYQQDGYARRFLFSAETQLDKPVVASNSALQHYSTRTRKASHAQGIDSCS